VKLGETSSPPEVDAIIAADEEVAELRRQIAELKHQLMEAKRQAFHWHQRSIRAEEVIEQQKNELTAVLKSKQDFHDSVVEYMLSIRQDQLTIENAIKSLRRPVISQKNWIGATVAALALIAFLYFNPQIVSNALEWLSYTRNQVFTLLSVAALGGIYYYSRRRKK